MNPTTRKYPRTLQEAFGPYTDNCVVEPVRPMDWRDKVVMAASVVAAVACFVAVVCGG